MVWMMAIGYRDGYRDGAKVSYEDGTKIGYKDHAP